MVSGDYLAVGSDEDHLYVPLGYHAATAVATDLGCLLPTPPIVDAVYAAATRRLAPQPLPPGPMMRSVAWLGLHQDLIDTLPHDGALVAGHKKDVVLSNRLWLHPGTVAIYGWHTSPAHPIQPLSTWHGAGYYDYSHALRLVAETALVDGRAVSLYAALADPRLAPVLTREDALVDPVALMNPVPRPVRPLSRGQQVVEEGRAQRLPGGHEVAGDADHAIGQVGPARHAVGYRVRQGRPGHDALQQAVDAELVAGGLVPPARVLAQVRPARP
jgi:hypothetical protein